MSFMNPADLRLILPEMGLTTFAFVVLLVSAAWPVERRRAIGVISMVALAATTALLILMHGGAPSPAGPGAGTGFPGIGGATTFAADGFAFYFKLLVLLSGLLSIAMSIRYLDYERIQAGEYYALILLAVVGMMFMASGTDFAVLYIGLELMALSVYVLVGFIKHNRKSNEAALKYFLLGAFSSGIFLYGVSLIYGTTGSTNLSVINQRILAGIDSPRLLAVGVIFVTVGLAFKVAAVPFHMWTPDAYEGAPTAVTAFMSTAVKASAFAMALRIYVGGLMGLASDWTPLVALLAAASMTLGNVTAVVQDNVKRMLAYSSIAHAGYILMGLVAIGAADPGGEVHGLTTRQFGLVAIAVYLGVYTFMNLGAFALVVMMRRENRIGDRIEDFTGLGRTHPRIGFAMLVFMLSLAGIPCTAGFIGKWWLFAAAVKSGYGWLAVLAVLNSAVSLYYYIRLVVAMYMGTPKDGAEAPATSPALVAVVTVSLAFTLVVGLWPGPFFDLARVALLPLGR